MPLPIRGGDIISELLSEWVTMNEEKLSVDEGNVYYIHTNLSSMRMCYAMMLSVRLSVRPIRTLKSRNSFIRSFIHSFNL